MTVDVEYAEGRDDALYLSLRYRTGSEASVEAMQALADYLWVGRSDRQDRPFREALAALVGELLKRAAERDDLFSYRLLSAGSFTGEPIGYRGFKEAFDRLRAKGFLDVLRGSKEPDGSGVATRLRANASLLAWLKDRGIGLADGAEHFELTPRPASISKPILARATSRRTKGKKVRGEMVRLDVSKPPASTLAQQVNDLNAYLAGVDIQPADRHYAFRRIFNLGDEAGFAWNKGGRLYSIGHSYQVMSSDDRKRITLDGKPVVEIDIRASHLTILHAKLGLPFDPAGMDPYQIGGLPRDIVKAWVTMTLGYDRFQTRWSKENKERFFAQHGEDLQKTHPIEETRERILARLPVLRDWPKCPVRWGDLQYIESCAIVGTVLRLAMDHGIPALPVHDSIIVPTEDQEIAQKTLSQCFKEAVGVTPALTTK